MNVPHGIGDFVDVSVNGNLARTLDKGKKHIPDRWKMERQFGVVVKVSG